MLGYSLVEDCLLSMHRALNSSTVCVCGRWQTGRHIYRETETKGSRCHDLSRIYGVKQRVGSPLLMGYSSFSCFQILFHIWCIYKGHSSSISRAWMDVWWSQWSVMSTPDSWWVGMDWPIWQRLDNSIWHFLNNALAQGLKTRIKFWQWNSLIEVWKANW